MKNLTYEAIRRDPELLTKMLDDARRERAEAVHRLISGAFRKLFSRPRRPARRPTLQTSACG